MTMTIRPIPTQHGGVRFRSRTEARWAVFFDYLHIPWEYEVQGFDIGDGQAYLPDFMLGMDNALVWIEVKPSVWADPSGVARWRKFIEGQPQGVRGALLVSMTGRSDQVFESLEKTSGLLSGRFPWSACPAGYHFDLMPRGHSAPCGQCGETGLSAPPWDDDKRISEAYSAALSARFGTG